MTPSELRADDYRLRGDLRDDPCGLHRSSEGRSTEGAGLTCVLIGTNGRHTGTTEGVSAAGLDGVLVGKRIIAHRAVHRNVLGTS